MVNTLADVTEGRTQNKAHNGSNRAVTFRYRIHSYTEDGKGEQERERKKEAKENRVIPKGRSSSVSGLSVAHRYMTYRQDLLWHTGT